jgi:tetratricopeptide (TPR) repeat protein
VADNGYYFPCQFRGGFLLIRPLCVIAMTALLHPARAQNASLGDVHFPTSCAARVQSRFDSVVALLHSFEFREAEAAFRQVEKDDPKCVIAAWGLALSTTERSGADAPEKDLAAGWAELKPWLSIHAKTEREQMYVDAVRAMYEGYAEIPGNERWSKYLSRMQVLRQRFPDDVNASLFYALGLTWTAGTGEKGLEQRRQALAILLPIFREHPDNPGAAHYIIHAADTAELAAEGLPAARRYATIAPDSPHALHMPSHIFNRLGYWKASIKTNEASARVAKEWMDSGRDGSGDEFHALNNMEYAYLQLGEDQKAQQLVDHIGALAKQGPDLWLLVDARIYLDLETHRWQDAAEIEPPSSSPFAENFDAYWIETIGAARSGNMKRAQQALEQYRGSATAWNKDHGGGDIHGVALAEAEAWTLFCAGKQEAATARLKGMAQYERDHPMYYADILPRPTGEMLGDMYLQMGDPSEALKAYEAALELAPNRLDSLLGAKAAATQCGNRELSRKYAQMIRAEGAHIVPRA